MDKQKVAAAFRRMKKGTVVIGIDGYVDEVWQLVQSRGVNHDAVLYTRMDQYAQRIQQASGGGMAVEILRKRRSYGGFTANTGNAIAKLGVGVTMLGLFGKDTIDPVFEPFLDMCEVVSVGDPATTHIFEFDDGKIMLPYEENTNKFNWNRLTEALGPEKTTALLAEADIIALGYWASMPDFDNIAAQICQNLPPERKTGRVFLDFADVRKRDQDSLKNALSLLRSLNEIIPMTLSMNEHEAAYIFAMHGGALDAKEPPGLAQMAEMRRLIGLDEIVAHTPHYAVAASLDEGVSIAAQNYCEKPVRTTGGGDTFNGGYVAALMAGLAIGERAVFANAVVRHFLNSGHAPGLDEILE